MGNYGNQNAPEKYVNQIAVHKAYDKVRQVAAEFHVPCVKKTFGATIVRVSCRTIPQLDRIGSILEELMTFDFIMEIGIPLEYSYKMKSLVLSIKAKNKHISNSIENVFKKSKLCYHHFTIEVKRPSDAAENFLKEQETNNSVQEEEKVATITQNAGKTEHEVEQLYTITFILTTGCMFLWLYIMFDL